jgi:NADPH:quinone reductase-like Zn-dependent oxidoreductase
MKAAYIEAHGGPEVLTYGDLPEPDLLPQHVKVRVRAAALNRLDTYVRAGQRGQRRSFPPAHIPGGDSAGDVVEVEEGVAGLSVGDRVVINPRQSCGQCAPCLAGDDDLCPHTIFMGSNIEGSYAEYVSVPAANAHRIADQVSYEEAAAAPTTFLPSWNILVRKAQLKPWETALVLSASAGVGTAAIQVANNVVGARVIATTSTPEKAQMARNLGASEVINYNEEDITERVKELTGGRGVDVVLDHVGAEFFERAFNSMAPGGRYGICGVTAGFRADLNMGALFTRQQQVFGVFMGSKEDMRQIVQMLDRGVIHPTVDRVFPLSEAQQAHEVMEGRGFFGKLVLQP